MDFGKVNVDDLERQIIKLHEEIGILYKEREEMAIDCENRIHELKDEVEKHKSDAIENYLKANNYETAFKMLVKELKK